MAMTLQWQVSLLQLVVILLINGHIAASTSIITTLPGFSGDLPFKLETGYVGVGDGDDEQLFYSFIESQGSPEYDPLVLFLTGGPGCTGFTAFLLENIGPLAFDYAHSTSDNPKLQSNPYSWTKIANIIFLDAPVGTGFSYRKNWKESTFMSDTLSAAETYEFLRKWLVDHPKFLKNPLYVGGDSYSGIVLPVIVKEISDGIEAGLEPPMNLKGYLLGNPVTDLNTQTYYRVVFSHRLALISDELYQSIKTECKGEDYSNVNPNNTLCLEGLEAYNYCIDDIYQQQVLEPSCHASSPASMGSKRFSKDLGSKDSVNLLMSFVQRPRQWCRRANYVYLHTWLNDKRVQNGLHVREGTVQYVERCSSIVNATYTNDVSSSVVYHRSLIKKGYRVLIYSGDHDFVASYVSTLGWIRSLKLTVASPWKPWFVAEQVAGYRMHYTNEEGKYQLTFATVKGAGHTAPEYKPEECFAMVSRWFSHYHL